MSVASFLFGGDMNNYCLRSDLAIEAREWAGKSIGGISESSKKICEGFKINLVKITNEAASKLLMKPMGNYYTFEMDTCKIYEDSFLNLVAVELSKCLRKLCKVKGRVLVVGLGNYDITSDSLGPKACKEIKPKKELCVLSPSVFYHTGMETADIIKGVVNENGISSIIAIDSLAARNVKRLFTTIQICDTGIMPGSGMGNNRRGINIDTMKVPVIAMGVPTVIDASQVFDIKDKSLGLRDMYVTPKDVDILVSLMSKCIGNCVNQTFV